MNAEKVLLKQLLNLPTPEEQLKSLQEAQETKARLIAEDKARAAALLTNISFYMANKVSTTEILKRSA